MAHIHNVIDTDVHYKIDGVTRTITNLDKTKRTIAQYDHNSERFTFEIPRYVDGHDFSECNLVQVHYSNADKYGKVKSSAVYVVDDLHIDNDDPNTVALSWLISSNATQVAGTLNFSIRFACVQDGKIVYAWNTTVFKGITIMESLYNNTGDVIDNADALVVLANKLMATVESRIARLEEVTLTLDAPVIEVEGAEEEESKGYKLSISCNSYGSETVVEINGVTQGNVIGTWENVNTVKIYSSNGDGIYFELDYGTFPTYSGQEVTLVDDVHIKDIYK